MSGFTKLDNGIVHSTIWLQPHDVLRVWIALLALADQNGIAHTAAPALAHLCMIPLDRMREILRILESPDEDSRSDVEEGRRILKLEGGWWLVNHASYRRKVSAEQKREADRVRVAAKRAAHDSQSQGVAGCRDLSQGIESVAEVAQAEAEAEAEEGKGKEQVRSRGSRLPTDWTLPGDWKEWARAERHDLDIETEAAKFSDHWHAKAGKDGIKLDWQATWRNWIRGARPSLVNKAQPIRESLTDRSARLNREHDVQEVRHALTR